MTDVSSVAETHADPVVGDGARWEFVAGGLAAATFFIGFLGWAAFAPLHAGAFASGKVAVSGNRQAVQHRDGGTVGDLRVAEGDRVKRGQVLLRLNVGDLRAEERGVAGQVYALLAQRARLIAERDKLAAPGNPVEFAALTGEDAALAAEALRLQRAQFAARGASRKTETGVLGQRVGQLQEQLSGLNRQIEANARQQALISEELSGLRSLQSRGFAPATRVREVERIAAGLEGEQGALRAEVARIGEQIGETRLQTSGVTTRLDEDVSEQLRQVQVQLAELQPRLRELRARLEHANVRSPATGQVIGQTVFTPGGVVQPGQVLMEIVPEQTGLIIVARLQPEDIDNVQLGQSTEVQFPGLRESNLSQVRGRVLRLSPDSLIDEATQMSFFRVEIAIPPSEIETLGSLARGIQAGAPAHVVVQTRKRTALSYLVEPLTRSLWKSGNEQ